MFHGVGVFSDEHHQRGGDIDNLPESMGAGLVVLPGGPTILGVALSDGLGTKLVSINERTTADAALYRAVLAHECAHLILEHGAGLCVADDATDDHETDAWYGAAFLGVPSVASRAILTGSRTVEGVAEAYGVPAALVTLRVRLDDLGDGLEAAHDDLLAWVRSAWEACLTG